MKFNHACFLVLFTGLLAPAPGSAGGPKDRPEAVADGLHQALSQGDADRVHELLDPGVLIFESGGVEQSLDEYASGHMHSDMEFMKEIERELLSRRVFRDENMAVVSSRSRLTGKFRDKEMDLLSTETLLLSKTEEGWKISHIHWSSRADEHAQ